VVDTIIAAKAAEGEWQQPFAKMLPAIRSTARNALLFRDNESRKDSTQDAVPHAIGIYRRLHHRSESTKATAGSLGRYAVLQHLDGRRFGTARCRHDVMHTVVHRRADPSRGPMPRRCEHVGMRINHVIDHDRLSILDQVAFRVGFRDWRPRLPERHQCIVGALGRGGTANDVANEFGISSARVSQLRRQYADSWVKFRGEMVNQAERGAAA